MVVTLHSSVHDSGITLLPDAFLGDLMVNPVGVAPHTVIDLAKFDRSTGVILHRVHKLLVEVTIIQEHIWIVPPSVEVSFDGFDGLDNTLQLLIPGKDDEGSIRSWATCVNRLTSSSEDLVMFLTDFPVERQMLVSFRCSRPAVRKKFKSNTNLIDGGAPAGMRIRPEEEGCRTKRRRIRTITRHGNNKTNPKGIEMDEFPFSRIRRLKNANLGRDRPFSREKSSIDGNAGAEGKRFVIR
jgi:hypothetical protein